MKKYLFHLIFLLFNLIFIVSCTNEIDSDLVKDTSITDQNSENGNSNQLSNKALITDFKLKAKDSRDNEVEATSIKIDQETKTVDIIFPFGAILKELTPIITVSEKANIVNTENPRDFSEKVFYIITAENKDEVTFTVNTSITPPENDREVLVNMYNSTIEEFKPNWDLNTDFSTWSGVTVKDSKVTNLKTSGLNLTGIRFLDQITTLSINNFNNDFGFPIEITELNNLVDLGLTLNPEGTVDIPNFIGNITSLKNLNINPDSNPKSPGPMVISLPPSIGNLTNLETLNISWSLMASLPNEISNLTNLKSFSTAFSSYVNDKVPESFNKLTKLESIQFISTILKFSGSLNTLTNLKSITIAVNNTVSSGIDPFIFTAQNLENLSLSGAAPINTISSDIKNLKNLKTLNLTATGLSSIPNELGEIPTLENLSFQGNTKLISLPNVFNLTNQPNLKSINIIGTSITTLDPNQCNLERNGSPIILRDDGINCGVIGPPTDPITIK